MTVLLQVSDAHFGTERPQVVDALRRLAQRETPHVVVWTGDLTQRARTSQFEAARRFTDSLPGMRHLAMPGNHDIPLFNVAARLFAPYRGYRQVFGEDLEPQLHSQELMLLMVKTTRRWRHKDGELSDEQVDRVARMLRQARPQQLRVVATHQPLHVMHEDDEHNRLHAPEDALAVWAEAGADIVMSGHTHRPSCYRIDGTHRPVWMLHAGTSISSRVRGEPNSVNVVRHRPGQGERCEVERWDFDEDACEFVQVDRVCAALAR